jgi:hypothetical protein
MSKKSGSRTTTLAAETLRNPHASDRERRMAASVLSQARPTATTSEQLATEAARIVENPNASKVARTLAASALAQAGHDNKRS